MLLLDSIAFRENLGILTIGLDTIMGHKPEVHIEIVQGLVFGETSCILYSGA